MYIHKAYQIKKGYPVRETIAAIKAEAMANAHNALVDLYDKWLTDAASRQMIRTYLGLSSASPMDALTCSVYLSKQYAKALVVNSRIMDITVSMHVHRWANTTYIIPICGGIMANVLDFLGDSRRLSDYAYWDVEGGPGIKEGVSQKAWNKRKVRWAKMMDASNGYYATKYDYVTLDICSMQTLPTIDPLLASGK